MDMPTAAVGLKKRIRSLDDLINFSTDDNDENNEVLAAANNIKKPPGKNRAVRKTKTNAKSTLVSTTKPINENKLPKHCATDDAEMSVACSTVCSKSDRLKCDFRDDFFHHTCTGLTSDLISGSITLINAIGWMCMNCRTDVRKILGIYRAGTFSNDSNNQPGTSVGRPTSCQTAEGAGEGRDGMDTTARPTSQNNPNKPTASEMQASRRSDSAAPQSSHAAQQSSQSSQSTSNSFQSLADVERVVRKTIKDASRRKFNIIVTGLHEPSATTDDSLFLSLCEEHLSMKPSIASNGTKRLGKLTTNSGKPRRLLIRFCTEQSASNMLAASRELRKSSDDYVARNIFFNPDLTREEEKTAYEKRVRRRTEVAKGDGASTFRTLADYMDLDAQTNEEISQQSTSFSGTRIILNSNLAEKKKIHTSDLSNLIVGSEEHYPKLGNSAGHVMPDESKECTNRQTSIVDATSSCRDSSVRSTLNANTQVFTPTYLSVISVSNDTVNADDSPA